MNVAHRLEKLAQSQPDVIAVAEPTRKYAKQKGAEFQSSRSDFARKVMPSGRVYKIITFRELNEYADKIAAGLIRMGVKPGHKIAALVTPGIDFVASVFGLLKSGAVMILIDPGMGGKNLLKCLTDADPDGFFAISKVHAIRCFMRRRFPHAKYNVTVGRRWFWGGKTLAQFRKLDAQAVADASFPEPEPNDPAAIIFTTGSTGPSKGVLYLHKTFEKQVDEIARQYGIKPGQIDLPGFPMFGLFNCAMGSTAVLPDLDASRPASVDPRNIIEAVRDWGVTQSFGSPAIWKKVGQYCAEHGQRLESVKMILSAGAPVLEPVMRTMVNCIQDGGVVHTPYGATEALPTATNDSNTILSETAPKTRVGAGVCVGNHFPSIQWKVIKIVDGPIPTLDQIEELPQGEIGELIVTGPQISPQYVTRLDANATGKIVESIENREQRGCGSEELGVRSEELSTKLFSQLATRNSQLIWHRMGDVGYLDDQDRFWFCGRMAHRVVGKDKTWFSIPTEAIFLQSELVNRAALVGVPEENAPDGSPSNVPVMIIEPKDPSICNSASRTEDLIGKMRELAKTSPLTQDIELFLVHPSFPVDIRHNAKIFREKLAIWAQKVLNR
ncbi:MAG: AMP-binding protein [Thermoguttaceae bacterium]|nr:AMP-binding protein [Thermoguttaceae bacterium]